MRFGKFGFRISIPVGMDIEQSPSQKKLPRMLGDLCICCMRRFEIPTSCQSRMGRWVLNGEIMTKFWR